MWGRTSARRATEVGFDGETVELGERGVDAQESKLAVEEAQADGGVIEQGIQESAFGFQLLEQPRAFLDGFLVLGDVPNDPGEDSAEAQAGLAQGQLHGKERAVLVASLDLGDAANNLLESGEDRALAGTGCARSARAR